MCLWFPPVGCCGRSLRQKSRAISFRDLAEPREQLARDRESFDGYLIAESDRVLRDSLAGEPGSRRTFKAPRDSLAVLVGCFDIELAVRTPVLPLDHLTFDLDEVFLLSRVVRRGVVRERFRRQPECDRHHGECSERTSYAVGPQELTYLSGGYLELCHCAPHLESCGSQSYGVSSSFRTVHSQP